MKSLRLKMRQGQTLVEFALILPVFILLVMFIFDMGRAVYYYSVLYNAVREGARSAAVGETDYVMLENVVVDRAFGMDLDPAGGVHFMPSGDLIVVEALYDYAPVTPVVSAFLPGGKITLRAETTMRLEFSP
jgi:hypothetical protein